MNKKFQDRWYVERDLHLTHKQLDRAIQKMKKRHPKENWIYVWRPANNQVTEYCSLEFVEWLKEVYLVKNIYYIDLEIAFYEKLINQIETEINIPHKEIEYKDMSKKELQYYFNRDSKSVGTAIATMCSRYNKDMKYISDDTIMIKAEGVKWLNEKYYRKSYLEYLEDYKHHLEIEYDK